MNDSRDKERKLLCVTQIIHTVGAKHYLFFNLFSAVFLLLFIHFAKYVGLKSHGENFSHKAFFFS